LVFQKYCWESQSTIKETRFYTTMETAAEAIRKISDLVWENLFAMLGKIFPPEGPLEKSKARQFVPSKELCEKDEILTSMLNSVGHEDVCYCVCDPDQKDLPIIFASDGFCALTGYSSSEIEGRNCRFLQGKDTKKEDVDRIRDAIKKESSASVNLLNYRKDGTSFPNEFFLAPLHDDHNKLVYVSVRMRHRLCLDPIIFFFLNHFFSILQYIGVQTEVPKLGVGQMPANPA
jgi:PAS domain S-box-containing protein